MHPKSNRQMEWSLEETKTHLIFHEVDERFTLRIPKDNVEDWSLEYIEGADEEMTRILLKSGQTIYLSKVDIFVTDPSLENDGEVVLYNLAKVLLDTFKLTKRGATESDLEVNKVRQQLMCFAAAGVKPAMDFSLILNTLQEV